MSSCSWGTEQTDGSLPQYATALRSITEPSFGASLVTVVDDLDRVWSWNGSYWVAVTNGVRP